ncbi:Sec-independent protein translocase TatA [Auraticoccus sp. F435]|uniref:Sec-independent protein translocase protein TatA n=1 Tax=Auraticoccus cholistanensis TaxID=2656650 RepID=A0A6A9UVF6_9ACTN|nr:twin-arginine translocase TatA/TatE family subunit [Auraticoccus cholistanensis]MVA75612.1 Sec-independent protein translocase TatA [Auraticoccus cholistanensis]
MGLPAGSEIIILIIVALVIFGGSRLAGIGKGTGRAIREFKEETASLRSGKKDDKAEQASAEDSTPPAPQPTRRDDVVDAEVVDPPTEPRRDA